MRSQRVHRHSMPRLRDLQYFQRGMSSNKHSLLLSNQTDTAIQLKPTLEKYLTK